ncbi:MAG: MBL fold metallo-hydrolase [Erysipelotrichaceae bacterium]|nr:MBL fold metallo-hydrolase [Erysipelotrichaceae bacterium]
MSTPSIIVIIVIVLSGAFTLVLWKNPKTNPVARLLIAVVIFLSVSLGVTLALTPPVIDTDHDGIEDTLDIDDDGDHYSDKIEITCSSDPLSELSIPVDHDHDLSPDQLDLDDDNDWVLDTVEILKGSDPLDANSKPVISTGKLTITFIDVGQALSILIQDDQDNDLLIDGGNNADASLIEATLSDLEVDDLEYVIATHYHEDHIGGLDEVIESFIVENVILPDATYTTATYRNLMSAVDAENANVSRYDFKGPLSFSFGSSSFEIIGPLSPFLDDQNNLSLVFKMTYENQVILLMGDADKESESLLIDYGYDLDADILGIGHHGSRTSSSEAFVSLVSPQYGIISVGTDNTYGLPDEDVIQRYLDHQTNLYRTDVSGTITLTIENELVEITTQK